MMFVHDLGCNGCNGCETPQPLHRFDGLRWVSGLFCRGVTGETGESHIYARTRPRTHARTHTPVIEFRISRFSRYTPKKHGREALKRPKRRNGWGVSQPLHPLHLTTRGVVGYV